MGLQQTFKNNFAGDFINEFSADSDNQYFLFFGKVDSWGDDNSPTSLVDSVNSSFSAYRNALGMKRIDRVNAFHIVQRYDWVSGTKFDQYDDTADMSSKKWYVMTDEYNIYKCISNAEGGASTSKPTHTEPEIKTAGEDMYRWKFLGKVTETARRFLTDEYIPVEYVTNTLEDENTTQLLSQQFAVDGSLDKIVLTPSDGFYPLSTPVGSSNRHTVLTDVVGSTDSEYNASTNDGLTLGLNRSLFSSDTSGDIPFDQLQYLGLDELQKYDVFTVIGRGPDVGQIRKIVEYYGVGDGPDDFGSGNTEPFVVLDRPFEQNLYSTGTKTKFRILPHLDIYGDGSNAEARCEVNSNLEISDVIVTNRGKDYTSANVEFTSETLINGSVPAARVIIAPKGGHGHNPITELQSSKVMLVVEVKRDELGKLRTSNEFRQFGIIKNPLLKGTSTIAGKESNRSLDVELSKPYGVDIPYVFSSDESTYKKGNYIVGQESFSTALIEDFRLMSGSTFSAMLRISKPNGKFISEDLNKSMIRFNLDPTSSEGTGTDFIVGEAVTQFDTPDNISVGRTAEGIVHSWNSNSSELVVEVIKNAFVGTATAGNVIGSVASYSPPFNRFENKGGELIKQFSVDATADNSFGGTMDFVTFDSDNKQNYGRIMTMGSIVDDGVNPVYNTNTRLNLQRLDDASAFSSDYFSEDQVVTQGERSEKVTGRVLEWDVSGGSAGVLYLTDVVGQFASPGYLDDTEGEYTITEVIEPDIDMGSGEVLYIENIRPVSRHIEQSEEFKILIGF